MRNRADRMMIEDGELRMEDDGPSRGSFVSVIELSHVVFIIAFSIGRNGRAETSM